MSQSDIKTASGRWHLIDADSSDGLPDKTNLLNYFEPLMSKAREVRLNAYAPYSRFKVGAAVLMGGEVFSGCNVENASYGATICAERAAIFAGVAAGHRVIEALALTTGASKGSPIESRSPCGICRQVISEFSLPTTPVLLDGGESDGIQFLGDIITVNQLLPWGFQLT